MKLSIAVRLTALLLIPALVSNNLAFAEKKPADPVAMKADLAARGVGAGVRVTLADNTQAKGIIVNVGDQSFALKVKEVDQPRQFQYSQVTGVHGTGLSTGAKIAIGVAIGAAAVVIGVAIAVKKSGY
jgi:hypothetical protein